MLLQLAPMALAALLIGRALVMCTTTADFTLLYDDVVFENTQGNCSKRFPHVLIDTQSQLVQ